MRVAMIAFIVCLAGCRTLSVSQFADAKPTLNPIEYLTGATRSWGVVENRRGEPTSRFRTAMTGVRDGDALLLTQDFSFDDGKRKRRVWRIRQVDAHRFDATATDVVGTATGYAQGNAFRWEYTLQVKPGNVLSRVHMKHWMYLADGGDTLVNRVVISKFGVVLRETTEYFQRGAGETATVGVLPAKP